MSPSAIRLVGGLFLFALYGVLFGPARAERGDDLIASVERWVAESRADLEAGRYEAALEPTLALVRAWPSQHVYAEQLARIYHRLDRCQDEAAAWEKVVATSPTPVDACPSLPDAYRCAGQAVKSLEALARCSAFDPTNSELLFHLGHARERAGLLDVAEATYREAVVHDGTHADSLLGIGRLRLHSGRPDEAAQAAASILASHPNHADALLLAGTAAYRDGRASEARTYLRRALEIAEGYVDVHIELGRLEIGSGHQAVARRHFERALQLDPGRKSELTPWLERTAGVR